MLFLVAKMQYEAYLKKNSKSFPTMSLEDSVYRQYTIKLGQDDNKGTIVWKQRSILICISSFCYPEI